MAKGSAIEQYEKDFGPRKELNKGTTKPVKK